MYKDYQIITDYDSEQLEKAIIALMNDGWQPIGGVTIVPYKNNPDDYRSEDFDIMMYAQAVVR